MRPILALLLNVGHNAKEELILIWGVKNEYMYIAFGNKEHITNRKWESRFYEVCNIAYTL